MSKTPLIKYVYVTALLTTCNSHLFTSIAFPQTTTTIPNSQPECVSVEPAFAFESQTLDVHITGLNTHFNETSEVSFSCQLFSSQKFITINGISVTSATEIIANITIAECPGICPYDVTIITGTEVITCSDVFEVIAAIVPTCLIASPSSAHAGETLDVVIHLHCVDLSNIENSEVKVGFGCPGITVNSVAITGKYEITANITVVEQRRHVLAM